ncbi:MAG: NACHT domain-containing protein [Halobacteriota archaeon]
MNEDITEKRVKDLEDNIRQDLKLLKDYEDKLRYETDPRHKGKSRREIELLHELIKRNQLECDELRRQKTQEELQTENDLTQQNEKERQALSSYLNRECTEITHIQAPGSTDLLVRDIVGSNELFIHLPWTIYQGTSKSEELVEYLIQVLPYSKRILLLGEPGQGKTIILKRVFTILANRFLQGSSDVMPIYIPLRDVTGPVEGRSENLLSLWKYLCEKPNRFPLSHKHFISLLRKDSIIFLFDGFDEITVELDQRSINERISSGMFSQPSVLSCRRNFYELYLSTSAIQQNYLEKIELLPLKFTDHASQYISAFCNRKGLEPEKIIKTIWRSQELLDLARRPLLLVMMLEVFIDPQEILEIDWNMAKLYDVYTEKWLKNEAAKPDSALRWHEKAALMEGIAWSMYTAGAPSSYSYGDKLYQTIIKFTRTDLINYLQPLVNDYKHIPFAQIVDDMCLRTFLIGSYGDYYYFIHKSFQEYYVAKHILRSMQHSAENAAQALQVSTPAEIAAFLEHMLSSKHIPKQEKDAISNNLIAAYQQNSGADLPLLIIREHASYYLACLGTPRAIRFLERAIDVEQNKWVQRGMMVGLGIFCGREDIMEKYIDILRKDPDAASINIGYNLAYYGDRPLEEGYCDLRGSKCDGFVRSIFRHLKSEKHKAIWALDLHTLRTLLEDEGRGMSILQANDEYIPFLSEFLSKDYKEYGGVFNREKNLLRQMDAKLNDVLSSQKDMQKDLNDLRKTLLARFDANEQKIISALVQRLDQNQLATVLSIQDKIETYSVPENELQETLSAIQQALLEIRQTGLNDLQLVTEAKSLSEVVDDPKLDVTHKLKVSVPIIPLILSYETEVVLKSGLNLKAAWQRLKARVRGEQ